MIGRLRGIIIEKKAPNLLLDVQGVGYEIVMPLNVFNQLPAVGVEITLLTHFIIREDGHFLYGFLRDEQRELFRHLIKVNGVGPKLGLAILSGMDANSFVRCIVHNDAAALERTPGIGKKLAQRLIMEMRDRLSEWQTSETIADTPFVSQAKDAISALITLGYKPHEARQAVVRHKDKNISSEELIRLALKEIK